MSAVAVSDPVLCGHGWPAVMSEISEELTGIWGLSVYSVVFKKSDYFYSGHFLRAQKQVSKRNCR